MPLVTKSQSLESRTPLHLIRGGPAQRVLLLSAAPGVALLGGSGGGRHLREVARAFLARGDQLQVLCRRLHDGRAIREQLAAPIEEVPRLSLPSPVRRRPLLEETLYDRRLRQTALARAETFRPTLVYERMSLFSSAGGSVARRLGIPLVLEVNAPLAEERRRYEGLRMSGPGWRATVRKQRSVLLAAARVVVVSDALRRWVCAQGVPAERVRVVGNGADARRFAPGPADPDLLRELDLLDRFVVGFFGSLKPWHGVDDLLRAMAPLAAGVAAGRRPVLLVGGAGPGRAELARLSERLGLADRVRWLGALSEHQVPRYQALCHALCAPAPALDSYWFAPLKVVEGMAQGLPLVATAQGDLPALLGPRNGRAAGLLVPPGRPEALTDALNLLASDAELRAALGQEGRHRVLRGLTWAHVLDRSLAGLPTQAVI